MQCSQPATEVGTKAPTEDKKRKIEEGRRHLELCCKLYRMQFEKGLYVLHEHPENASSWSEPYVKALLEDHRVKAVNGDMGVFGMDENEEAVKEPTRFMTNAMGIAQKLSVKYNNYNNKEIFPEELCGEIVKGLIDTMKIEWEVKGDRCGMCVRC